MFELHAELLKALSHPKRLEILHLLRDQTLTVTQIQDMLDLPQANLSQHLTVLRNHRVVVAEKQGKEVHYSVAHQDIITASDMLREVLAHTHIDNGLAAADHFRMSDYLPLVTDPVCGMRISPKTAGSMFDYQGQPYYFCASGCYKAFAAQPARYVVES